MIRFSWHRLLNLRTKQVNKIICRRFQATAHPLLEALEDRWLPSRVQPWFAPPLPPLNSTHFRLTAPSTTTAGSFFSVTVTALDSTNHTVTSYTGTVHFTSSDGIARL